MSAWWAMAVLGLLAGAVVLAVRAWDTINGRPERGHR